MPPAGTCPKARQTQSACNELLLRERRPELVTYSGWEAIDRHERALGEPPQDARA